MNEEMKQILNLSNEGKYDYFIEKAVETGNVWILRDEEGCASLEKDGTMFLPMWPESKYSDLCISVEWAGYQSTPIPLDVLMERWLPGLKEDGIRLTVFWMDGKGVEVSIDDLLDDLKEELQDEDSEG